jgi:hypothetical protein
MSSGSTRSAELGVPRRRDRAAGALARYVFAATLVRSADGGAVVANALFLAATLAARSEYAPIEARGQVFSWVGALARLIPTTPMPRHTRSPAGANAVNVAVSPPQPRHHSFRIP